MNKTVYLIGHGRVDQNKVCRLQSNTTVHWLAPLGDVTGGLSRAFLSGALDKDFGTSPPNSTVLEHYLCADVTMLNDRKIDTFFKRKVDDPHQCTNPYLLFTRQKVNVSLSSIASFLYGLSSTMQWHLYWTCCRGYIGVANPMKTSWLKDKVVREKRIGPPVTPQLTDQDHATFDCDFDSVMLIAKSDWETFSEEAKKGTVLAPLYSSLIDSFDADRASQRKGPVTTPTAHAQKAVFD